MKLLREALALAGLAVQAAVLAYYWGALPSSVPTHFNAIGAIDGYGPKNALLIVPLVTVLLYCLLSLVCFFPESFNYPVPVTDENRGRLEPIAFALLGWLKAELAWLFVYLTWGSIRAAVGQAQGLGWEFLPATLAAVLGTIIAGVVRMRRVA
jgi:hypothetical protein